jgi:hypothetical protein
MGSWRGKLVWLFVLVVLGSASLVGAAPEPPGVAQEARELLVGAQAQTLPPIRDITLQDDVLTVCLDVEPDLLADSGWLGIEWIAEAIRSELITLSWQSLSVRAWDPRAGVCRPLSDFAPADLAGSVVDAPPEVGPTDPEGVGAATVAAFPRSLAGKTVYMSAGHGWLWSGSFLAPRSVGVYEGFIEDHNNAEVVERSS